MPNAYIEIRMEKCKGCRLCMVACPEELIVASNGRINALGYDPVAFEDADGSCKGCKMCAEMCPDACIEVFRARKNKAKTEKPEK